MKKVSLFLSLIILFTSCDKPVVESTVNPSINPQKIKVELHKCTVLTGSNTPVQICLDSVKEGRCPLPMMCFWAGEVTVKLSLQGEHQKQSFHLSTLDAPPFYRQDTTILGAHVKLLSVTPYPGDSSLAPYRVELSINQ